MNAANIGTALTSTSRLPVTSINAMADLVAVGYGMAAALEALPRQSLRRKLVRQLDKEIAELQAGAPLDRTLERLGLEITAATIRSSQAKAHELEAALRSDATAQLATAEGLSKTRLRIGVFVIVMAGLGVFALFASIVLVPKMLEDLVSQFPGSASLSARLMNFEHDRNLWLAAGGAILLMGLAMTLSYAGALGWRQWIAFLHDLRLYLPFLRAHAIHASSARLLKTIAHEQVAGIPANDTIRRVQQREPVPRLRTELDLIATRLEAGDPWKACLGGTLYDSPLLADLAALAGHGAKPTQSWHWAANQSQELAVRDLRRVIISAAVIVLVPSFLFLMVLMRMVSTTTMVAQLEATSQQIETLTTEVQNFIMERR